MKLRKPNSKFYRWWNSYTGKRIVSAAYSLGASIVIMGAMFKILHLPIGNIMLGVGMSVESLIFALGIFDKPYREYDWSKIFNFKANEPGSISGSVLGAANAGAVGGGVAFVGGTVDGKLVEGSAEGDGTSVGTGGGGGGGTYIVGSGGGTFIGGSGYNPSMSGEGALSSEDFQAVVSDSSGVENRGAETILTTNILTEEDIQKLTEGIRNLSATAENLQSLANVALSAGELAKSIESASESAANFVDMQQKLNTSTETLATSYLQVNSEIDQVVNNTRSYSGNVESVNRSLVSINSVYEIQLRYIQSQTENIQQQAEAIRKATQSVDGVATDMEKMRVSALEAQAESQRYQAATRKLSKQVEDLNAIYGNMLNALS